VTIQQIVAVDAGAEAQPLSAALSRAFGLDANRLGVN
jgi:hypothetical protein